MSTADAITVFLDGAHVIAGAIAEPAVAQAWDRPSVLEGQMVGGLAGHLARGGVWVVDDYLDGSSPSGPVDFESAGEYFAAFADAASADAHQAIRDRGAAIAAVGPDDLVRQLDERLHALETRLRAVNGADLVAVVSGSVMRVADYLATRIVEQVVHLDDLARSIGREPWPYPPSGEDLAIDVGVDIARRRRGRASLLRALYRRGFAEAALPVL